MAGFAKLRRRLCWCLQTRNLVLIIPMIWASMFLWTFYTTRVERSVALTQRQIRGVNALDKHDPVLPLEEVDSKVKGHSEVKVKADHEQQGVGPGLERPRLKFEERPNRHHKSETQIILSQNNHAVITFPADVEKQAILPGHRTDPPRQGEFGKAVRIDPASLSPSERSNYDTGWSHHEFNEYVSTKISTQRETPDNRYNACKDVEYDVDTLPQVSIIICFYNEAWSVLLRTINSVFMRSPPELVKEVILVDDCSDAETMHAPLEHFVSHTTKLRLIRMNNRSGLVRARHAGVSRARAPVLLFLDSHVECEEGWLPPLLQTVAIHPNVAVTPEIDIVDAKTFAITPAIDNVGILVFETFSFDWAPILPRLQTKRKSDIDLIESPTMAGGLFAIRKDYFLELGGYDEDLKLWGGENIELSLKLWMCGGGIMIHPCSRVAHIFRDQSPYLKGSNANVLEKNSARVAQIWADDYRDFFFRGKPYDEAKFGDVSERLSLKEKLQCKSFGWYLANILPEVHIAGTGRFFGPIEGMNGGCIHRLTNKEFHPPSLFHCRQSIQWEYSNNGEIRSRNLCLAVRNRVSVTSCSMDHYEVFEYRPDKTILHVSTGRCLTAVLRPGDQFVSVEAYQCSGDINQKWIWRANPSFIRPNESHLREL